MTDDENEPGTRRTETDEQGCEGTDRSTVRDELDVPESPPDPATTEHVLPDEKLSYPTFEFESGGVSPADGFDLSRDLDREAMREWLDALAGSIASHDAAVEGTDRRVTFGVRPADVRMRFEPDEDHRGRLEVTFALDAKALKYEDADARPAGARGGRGFIPFAMLTEDRDPQSFRCYNWIGDPTGDSGIGDPTGDSGIGDPTGDCGIDDSTGDCDEAAPENVDSRTEE